MALGITRVVGHQYTDFERSFRSPLLSLKPRCHTQTFIDDMTTSWCWPLNFHRMSYFINNNIVTKLQDCTANQSRFMSRPASISLATVTWLLTSWTGNDTIGYNGHGQTCVLNLQFLRLPFLRWMQACTGQTGRVVKRLMYTYIHTVKIW